MSGNNTENDVNCGNKAATGAKALFVAEVEEVWASLNG